MNRVWRPSWGLSKCSTRVMPELPARRQRVDVADLVVRPIVSHCRWWGGSLFLVTSDDALVTFLLLDTCFLSILGYPLSENKLWGKQDPVRLGSSGNCDTQNCGVFEIDRRFPIEKLRLISKESQPTVNQVHPIAWYLQLISQIPPWMRPFLATLYSDFGNRSGCGAACGGYCGIWSGHLASFAKRSEVFCPR